MLLELDPKGQIGEPAPILVVELVRDRLVRRPELWRRLPSELRIPPAEAVLVVVPPYPEPTKLPK